MEGANVTCQPYQLITAVAVQGRVTGDATNIDNTYNWRLRNEPLYIVYQIRGCFKYKHGFRFRMRLGIRHFKCENRAGVKVCSSRA